MATSVEPAEIFQSYVELWAKADSGDPEAQYQHSSRVRTPTEAYRWLCLAASQGVAEASAELGHIHRHGTRGQRRDLERSYMWWSLAEEQGYPKSALYRLELAGLLSPDQVADAQRMAAAWQASDCESELL